MKTLQTFLRQFQKNVVLESADDETIDIRIHSDAVLRLDSRNEVKEDAEYCFIESTEYATSMVWMSKDDLINNGKRVRKVMELSAAAYKRIIDLGRFESTYYKNGTCFRI